MKIREREERQGLSPEAPTIQKLEKWGGSDKQA